MPAVLTVRVAVVEVVDVVAVDDGEVAAARAVGVGVGLGRVVGGGAHGVSLRGCVDAWSVGVLPARCVQVLRPPEELMTG